MRAVAFTCVILTVLINSFAAHITIEVNNIHNGYKYTIRGLPRYDSSKKS